MLSRLRIHYERVSSDPKSLDGGRGDSSDALLVRVRRRLSARVVKLVFLISFAINAIIGYQLAKDWYRGAGYVAWRGAKPLYSMHCSSLTYIIVAHLNITAPVDPPVHQHHLTPAQEGRTPYHEPPTDEVDRLWSDLYAPCGLRLSDQIKVNTDPL